MAYPVQQLGNASATNTATDVSAFNKALGSADTSVQLALNDLDEQVGDGWNPARETWSYASATTFTISGDRTGLIGVGDKIKLTQTTVKYFRVTAVSYSSPNTTVTVSGFYLYSLASATITNPYFSKCDNPQGFPRREVELYSNGSGTTGNITLAETTANFSILEFYYTYNGRPFSAKTFTQTSYALPATAEVYEDSQYWMALFTENGTISGTTLTRAAESYRARIKMNATNTCSGATTTTMPLIFRIVGYRW